MISTLALLTLTPQAGTVSTLPALRTEVFDRYAQRASQKIELTNDRGVLTLGGREPRRYLVTITRRADGTPILGLDEDRNGVVEPREQIAIQGENAQDEKGRQFVVYLANRQVRSPYGGRERVGVFFQYLQLPGATEPFLHAYVNYQREGQVSIGRRKFRAQLRDHLSTGDFTRMPNENGRGVVLRVDLNENGKFDKRGEEFVLGRPFKIGGQVYQARALREDGSRISIAPSAEEAAEVPPPFVPRVGAKIEPFEAKALDGRTVRFPEDYRGKKVLVDFFGSWRSASIEALPALAALRRSPAGRNLEFLTVAIDFPDAGPKVQELAKKHEMDWPILFDTAGWQGPVVQRFNVVLAPSRFLVDGSTGRILALPEYLSNEQMGKTLERALRTRVPEAVHKLAQIEVPADVRDRRLYLEIARRVEVDQAVRQHASSGGDPEGLYEWWGAVDANNLKWLKGVLAKYGWPGKSLVGQEGAHNVWLMVQHTDKDKAFQAHALTLMEAAVKKGEASGKDFAYLTDRVLTGAGKKQRYGTQLTSAGGWLRPQAIEDEANVDRRRAEVGLGPIAEYVERAAASMRLPTKPPTPKGAGG